MKKFLFVVGFLALMAVFFVGGRAAGHDTMPVWGIAAWVVIYGLMGSFLVALALALVGCVRTWRSNPATRDLF